MRHEQGEESEERPVRLSAAAASEGPREAEARPRSDPTRPRAFERMLTEVIVSGGARLLRLAASICPQDAEDILNIATERALGRPEAFAHGEPARLYRWLEKVVRNEALKTLRARRREQLTDPETLAEVVSDSSARGPDEILAATEERIATLEALAELHPVEASCLALRARGYSRAEIAELLGITPLTVKRRLADGRASLGAFSEELASGRRCARMRPRLSDYLDRCLEGRELRGVERHLDHCGRCRGHVVYLRRQRSRIAAALPSTLLLAAAEAAATGGEHDLQVTRQLVETAHDGWLALSGGIWARAIDGWHALSPIGRIAGTAAAALLALAGVGTFVGSERGAAPPPDQHASAPVTASPKPPPVESAREESEPKRPASASPDRPRPQSARQTPPPVTAGGAPGTADKVRAVQPAHTASSAGSPDPAAAYSPPAPSNEPSDEALARSEFEPGPP